MGKEGVEPSQPFDHRILSPACIPFHHLPNKKSNIFKRREPDSNRRIVVLQTTALPLGYRAKDYFNSEITSSTISSISAIWPSPTVPQANFPLMGSTNLTPVAFNFLQFS